MEVLAARFCSLWLLVVLVASSAFAQANQTSDAWESKPVDKWDQTDVGKILRNSAWSHLIENKAGVDSFLGTIRIESRAMFSLRSALIIRLARIRNLQLKENYDSMDSRKKGEFNKKYKPILACVLCEKFYIMAVAGDSRILKDAGAVKRRASLISLSNEKGEKRELANYTAQTSSGSEALFFFPRYNEKGEPLLGAQNVTLTFRFKYEDGDDPVIKLLERVEVKVLDIVREEKVIF